MAAINVIRGENHVKMEVTTLILDCKEILTQLQITKIFHVLRYYNKCADFLANKAQASAWGTIEMEQLPEGIKDFLELDILETSFRRVKG